MASGAYSPRCAPCALRRVGRCFDTTDNHALQIDRPSVAHFARMSGDPGGAGILSVDQYLAMKTLAEVLLFALETLSMAEEPGLDWQACGDVTDDMWRQLASTSSEERKALSEAAGARLKELLREPDEYGYSPRKLVTSAQKELLESLIDGSAFDELDGHDRDDGEKR